MRKVDLVVHAESHKNIEYKSDICKSFTTNIRKYWKEHAKNTKKNCSTLVLHVVKKSNIDNKCLGIKPKNISENSTEYLADGYC